MKIGWFQDKVNVPLLSKHDMTFDSMIKDIFYSDIGIKVEKALSFIWHNLLNEFINVEMTNRIKENWQKCYSKKTVSNLNET